MDFNKWYFVEGPPVNHYEIITSMLSGKETRGEKCYVGWWLDNAKSTIQFNEWAHMSSKGKLKEPKLIVANKKKMIRDIFNKEDYD